MAERSAGATDVVVIGGGVIGLAIAWRAAQRGLGVTVVERGRPGYGTSHFAAGMLAPAAEVTPGEEAVLDFGLRSARMYPEFVRELLAATGAEGVGYTPCGTLMVARDNDEAEALERELELRRGHGLRVQRLRPSEARRLEPGLAPALRLALEVPDDHAVDPRALTAVLATAVRNAGAELLEGQAVDALEHAGGRVEGVRLADGTSLQAGQVVVSAGVWSPQLQGLAQEAQMPVRPVKGQVMRLRDPAGSGLMTRVLRMGPSYITPRGDGRYVIGATQEERGFDQTVTAGAGFDLLRDALELVPGVSELVLDEFSAGLRPGTPDNLPIIGPGALSGLHWATGHRRGGILLTPVTAELVAGMLAGEAPPPEAELFSPARFSPGRSAPAPLESAAP